MTGRLTLPTDADIIDETIRLKNLLGADALRDCDGTEMPEALLSEPVKKYATYYTTRKDNAWAMKHPEEIQQEYLISNRITARGETLRIRLMEGFHTEQLKVNTLDDPKRWWEVIDRTTGEVVPTDAWEFDEASGEVEIRTIPYHEYTVSFLAFLIWDPVHMYNFITNDWKDTPHQLTYDVRQPKTKQYVKDKLRKWCEDNPHIDVVRFTTFFHQFTLTFDDKKREKFVEWFGYSASVSPYILEQLRNGQATNSARSTLWIRDITTACSAFPADSSWIS
jgi:1,3-beta-galactosyl-N-acetylhexosamine phosphorylase